MRKLFLLSLVLVLFLATFAALADKPPDALYQHVVSTSQLVHRGECNVKSMHVENRQCLIFYNPAIERVWVVLFDTDKNGAPQVTHVLLVDEVGKEVVAWCRNNVCV